MFTRVAIHVSILPIWPSNTKKLGKLTTDQGMVPHTVMLVLEISPKKLFTPEQKFLTAG